MKAVQSGVECVDLMTLLVLILERTSIKKQALNQPRSSLESATLLFRRGRVIGLRKCYLLLKINPQKRGSKTTFGEYIGWFVPWKTAPDQKVYNLWRRPSRDWTVRLLDFIFVGQQCGEE